MATGDTPALECRDISVNYGDVAALSGVSAAFATGLIHAVVGQNGAGKTTFARVAAGLVRPQMGSLFINGESLTAGNVQAARAVGIELVHQSFALPPSFTVAEAMEYGAQDRSQLYTRSGLNAKWRSHLESIGVVAQPGDRIRDLPVETQQGVEIARALVADARVLILDEPTAVLSPSGIEVLFKRVRRLKERGVTVLLILHKIREVLAIADTVTVLRGGRLIEAAKTVSGVNAGKLAELIVGTGTIKGLTELDAEAAVGAGALNDLARGVARTRAVARPMLTVNALTTRPDGEGPALRGINVEIGQGEILGIAGVEGNGQRTLVRALADLAQVQSGQVLIEGHDMTARALAERRGAGLRVIPFERNTEGLSLASSLWENWSVSRLLAGPWLSLIDPDTIRLACDAALKTWDVHYTSATQKAASLSGGNAQKVILAREMDDEAKLIIAAQPTRGLDVGATAFVWKALREARAKGCGVLLISSDLDELFDISDRIAVMYSGKIAGVFSPPYDIAAVGAAMTGAQA